MDDFTTCNLCLQPGKWLESFDKQEVRCHLRSLSHLQFNVWRCANCLSLHALEPADLDFFYLQYPFRAQKLDAGTRTVYANRLRLLRAKGRLEKQHSILDYGSGQGLFVSFLKEKGYKNSFAYDPYMTEMADADLLSRKYDCVIAQDVLEHVGDPIACLKVLSGCLKENAVLVVGTPNAEGIDLKQPLKYANELHQPYHRHIPSLKVMMDIFRRLGFIQVGVHNRYYFDTLIPGVNTRFINEYTFHSGAFAEALVDPPNWLLMLKKPSLVYFALAGYWLPGRANMMIFCRK